MLWEVIDGKENSLAKRRKVLKANDTQTSSNFLKLLMKNRPKSLTFDNSSCLYFLFYRYLEYQGNVFHLDPELIGHPQPQTHSMLCYVMCE